MVHAASTQSLQRVGFLVCVPELLRRFGLNPAEVLDAVGLHAQALADPEGTIPYQTMGKLVELAAIETQCPHFGLEIGKQIHVRTLGLIGELMQNAPSLRAALQDFVAHHHRNSHGGVVYLLEDDDRATLGYAVCQQNVPGYSVICDGAALAAFNLVVDLVGANHTSDFVGVLSRTQPDDSLPYKNAFRVPLYFNAEQTGVSFPRRLLDLPIAGAEALSRKEIAAQLRTKLYAGGLDVVTRVTREVRVGLLAGNAAASDIALKLGIKRWKLDRELDACGMPFQKALDETRREYAQQLLANTRLPITDIATIVGYSDPSTLTRSFARWTGLTPSAWRATTKINPEL